MDVGSNRKNRKKYFDDDGELGEEYGGRSKKDEKRKNKDTGLNMSEDFVEDYDEVKRKNKDMMFSPEKPRNPKKVEEDNFEDSDFEKRPDSSIQRGGSKGKGHLGIEDSESDH